MRPPFYSDDCYISIVRNADKFIKCYILDISEDYKSAFLKYRHMGYYADIGIISHMPIF